LGIYLKNSQMKRISFLIVIFAFIFQAKAEVPDWTVNPNDFSYNMTITGTINIDKLETTDPNDMVGVFINGECRGSAQPEYNEQADRYIFYLMAYSNTVGDTLEFKIYDASGDEVRTVERTAIFEINGIIGSIDAPFIISNPTLSSESKILSFNIDEQVTETIINEYDIFLEMPWGYDLTNLVANYVTSELAKVRLGGPDGVTQESNVTANDFTDTLVYWVMSADETDTSWYNVVVRWVNQKPTWIYLSDTIIDETYRKGSFIGYLSSEDLDPQDIHTYSFVEGEGDIDNYRFLIDGNALYLNEDVYFQTDSSFSVRIQTDDGKGGQFERPITIIVEFISNSVKVRANNIISPNGDGLFDVWTIQNPGLYKDFDFYIYNGIGETIFHSVGYDIPWDGTYNGQELPIGAYYYVIKSPDGQILKGVISLIK